MTTLSEELDINLRILNYLWLGLTFENVLSSSFWTTPTRDACPRVNKVAAGLYMINLNP